MLLQEAEAVLKKKAQAKAQQQVGSRAVRVSGWILTQYAFANTQHQQQTFQSAITPCKHTCTL
jgi:hypothetical protein